MNLEEERDALRRELVGIQEMLFAVLNEVGEPVVIPKSTLREKRSGDVQIRIDEEDDSFVFSVGPLE